MEQISITWKGGMAYEALVDGFSVPLDAAAEHGGENGGPRPKPLLLVALAGCTGMDVASLARKMRVEFSSIVIDAEADKGDEMPAIYTAMRLIYRFEGAGIDPEKPLKMVALSQERYCGVSAMLAKAAPVTYQVWLNGEQIG